MKHIRLRFIIILGIISLSSCQKQEESTKLITNARNTIDFYDLVEESLDVIFKESYEKVTINTSFGDVVDIIEKNSKDFFINKGFIITDSDIARTRGTLSNPFNNINDLKDNQKEVINKVTTILQLPVYEDVRLGIYELYNQILKLPLQEGREELLRYIKYIENILNMLEREKSKIDVLNVIVRYNEFHEIKLNTRADLVSLPDGIYPHPLDKNKFIMVVQGHAYELKCGEGLVYCHSAGGCTFPDTCNNENNDWWERWGKCAAAILGGAGIEGLGGAGIGSAVPGIGTLTGAIIGAISGAFTGAVAGC